METRPKIKIKKKPLDWCIETVCFLFLLAHWVAIVFVNSTLWISLIPSTLIYVVFTILQKFPHTLNYATAEVTEQNAEKLYEMGIRMAAIVKMVLVISFSIPIRQTIFKVSWFDEGLISGGSFAVIFLIAIYYIFRMSNVE
ncbi:hypothetical protein FACS189429_4980 [Bacteroidia bacterium]|nr:hypothetical protein FACS189429_4980 [Bacteroidia bacterium]